VALVSWHVGGAPGAITALLGAAALVLFDPFIPRPTPFVVLAGAPMLLVATALGAFVARRMLLEGWGGVAALVSKLNAQRAAPTPTPTVGVRALGGTTGEYRRFPAVDESAPEHTVEQEVVERFLHDVRGALGADVVVLWEQRDSETDDFVPLASAPAGPIPAMKTSPPADSLLHWALQQRMPASNYDTDDAFFLIAPIGRNERRHRALGIYAADRQAVSKERARTHLPRYAARLASLLELVEDGRETRRYRGKAEALASAAEHVQSHTDIVGLGRAICEAALKVSGATRAALVLWDEEERDARAVRSDRTTEDGRPAGTGRLASLSTGHPIPQDFPVSAESFVGVACRDRQRFAIREAYRMSDFPIFGPGEPARRVNSLAVVPLQRDGRTLGAIAVEGDEEAQLTAVEGSLLSLLASVASVALENVRQLEEVTVKSITDSLTGLPNRRVFDDRLHHHLAECDRFNQVLSLILLDIDHFKQINDTHGHAAGDAVLVAIAQAIAHDVRNIDLCARYGGEELAILLPQTPLDAALDVAERLRRTVESIEVVAGAERISVTISLGVACYPHSTGRRDAFFGIADQALYAAKHAGRNCVMSAPTRYSQNAS
jgi:diguanylate cyclase (GGDEF)-like protein